MQKNILLVTGYWLLVTGIIGCASAPYYAPLPVEGMPGLYHRVEKGQTLWRIAKIYSIDLDELVRINRICEPTKIESGQLIFIPKTRNLGSAVGAYQQNLQLGSEDFIWPLKGTVISRFGQNINNVINQGIDIEAAYGNDVVAARSGRVSFYKEQMGGLGKTIIIDHGDNFMTVYARNADILVTVDEKVTQGKVIAKVGNAGREKKSFLHFEIRKGHIPQNPYYYLP